MTYPHQSIFILITILLIVFTIGIVLLLKLLKKKTLAANAADDNTLKEEFVSYDIFAREIKSLKEQLSIQERLATLGEVSAGIAHELRNPLMVISGNSRLLLKGLTDPEQIELAEAIIKEVEEINSIIEELLKFAHGSRHETREFDLVELIRGTIKSIPEGERVIFSEPSPLPFVGDEKLLRQALKNIIKNALEAGQRVWVNIEKRQIDSGDTLDINVVDNGNGLTKEEINKIFLPFYSTKESGFGMGLTLVQKIALEHGGSVRVTSEPGKGSKFTLSLPVKR